MSEPFACLRRFLSELKRRRVYRVAVTYVTMAFVGFQAVKLLIPSTTLPPWADELLLAFLVVGFPVALVLAWAFEVTPEGVRRARSLRASEAPGSRGGKAMPWSRHPALFFGTLFVGALALAGYAVLANGTTPSEERPEIRSLAVLPLDNLSGDPEQDYFTNGMTEALIAELGQVEALKVISRTSAMHYRDTERRLPEIARELDVDGLIEGSVFKAEDEVRITLQLVHGPTDRHLWSRSYERELRDVLALQGEVASAIAEEIQITVSPEEGARLATARAVDPEAHTLYLRGNNELGKGTETAFQQALAYFQQAIALDSTYAQPYAGMAMAYVELGSWMASLPPSAVHSQARAAAMGALERDSTLAEAHIALGRIKHLFEWDWAGAEVAFRRGIELNPSSAHALYAYHQYLMTVGRFEEAVASGRRRVARDPLSPTAYGGLGLALVQVGREADALKLFEKALELPPHPWAPHVGLSELYVRRGQLDKAYRSAARAEEAVGADGSTTLLGLLGHVYAKANRRAEARRILRGLETRAEEEYVPPNALALLYLGLGEKGKALDLLERGYEVRDVTSVWHKIRWVWDPLRDEPRFQAILRRMNFPDT